MSPRPRQGLALARTRRARANFLGVGSAIAMRHAPDPRSASGAVDRFAGVTPGSRRGKAAQRRAPRRTDSLARRQVAQRATAAQCRARRTDSRARRGRLLTTGGCTRVSLARRHRFRLSRELGCRPEVRPRHRHGRQPRLPCRRQLPSRRRSRRRRRPRRRFRRLFGHEPLRSLLQNHMSVDLRRTRRR